MRMQSIWLGATLLGLLAGPSDARESFAGQDQFEYLASRPNCDCSAAFIATIATLPHTARLQGGCCAAMDRARYTAQTEGLTGYRAIPEIPPDPYDVPAPLAHRLISYDALVLTTPEQRTLEEALQTSRRHGPCCCECWRWVAYRGLAKFLIRMRGFTGAQIVAVWDLSDACGRSMAM